MSVRVEKPKPGTIVEILPEKLKYDHTPPLSEKHLKLQEILQSDNVDLLKLREATWGGIPDSLRPECWMLLTGYLPANRERRATIDRKRAEYAQHVDRYFNSAYECTDEEKGIRRQIRLDVPRTNPEVPLFHTQFLQGCLERVLYVWSIRHPASGYVQGINDLVTPFLLVFLLPVMPEAVQLPLERCEELLDAIGPTDLARIEADTYWCLASLLDSIQDHYTAAQPGIQRLVIKLDDLVHKVSEPLHQHLHQQGVEFIQFSFRWMNCLLLRELSLPLAIRLWDTYLSEGTAAFPTLHVYVCASFLTRWSEYLCKCDFVQLMLALQSLPPEGLKLKDLEEIISLAWMWRELYENSNHIARPA
eukprot:TRINITY_DN32504_c0_g1_i1.p1 TRINITY_DN32504_c0_g1~~TRINITY_DN32504_c0_g1_i1.p1  ORF type:complete len:361 (+),score=33.23 TRINITY_DN32504_c0_g1_i1:43-1125(+)